MNLSRIRSEFRKWNLRPSKRLGQNFLIDGNVQGKILNAIDIRNTDAVLEIGPGLGALTEGLCARARDVLAVEKDKRLCEFLSKNIAAPNLKIVNADILDFLKDMKGPCEKIKVVGNLPYYISSPIITGLLEKRGFFDSLFITVQREFAERLVALPGSRDYGSISCFVQFYSDPRLLFTVKKTCFYPVPKVDSCFVRFGIKERGVYPVGNTNNGVYLTDEAKLFRIIRACFEKRRKTILNSLYSGGWLGSKQEITEKLGKAGILPDRRPETLSLKEFIGLTEVL